MFSPALLVAFTFSAVLYSGEHACIIDLLTRAEALLY